MLTRTRFSLFPHFAVAIVLFQLGACDLLRTKTPIDKAQVRVSNMMKNWKAGKNKLNRLTQTTICIWYANRIILPQEEVYEASTAFDEWRAKKNLINTVINKYKIHGAKYLDGSKKAVIVTVSINDEPEPYNMVVLGNERIIWDPSDEFQL